MLREASSSVARCYCRSKDAQEYYAELLAYRFLAVAITFSLGILVHKRFSKFLTRPRVLLLEIIMLLIMWPMDLSKEAVAIFITGGYGFVEGFIFAYTLRNFPYLKKWVWVSGLVFSVVVFGAFACAARLSSSKAVLVAVPLAVPGTLMLLSYSCNPIPFWSANVLLSFVGVFTIYSTIHMQTLLYKWDTKPNRYNVFHDSQACLFVSLIKVMFEVLTLVSINTSLPKEAKAKKE